MLKSLYLRNFNQVCKYNIFLFYTIYANEVFLSINIKKRTYLIRPYNHSSFNFFNGEFELYGTLPDGTTLLELCK